MINSELNIKTIPLDMLERYFTSPNDEEKYIVEQLKELPDNLDNFNKVKEKYEAGGFPEPIHISQKEYEELLNKYYNSSNEKFNLSELKCNPKSGEIWSLKKKISLFGYDDFDCVAQTKYVYIVTDPEPYTTATNEMNDITKNYKEYFSSIVLPISFNTEFAIHEDYIVKENNDFLGIEFMIQTGLESNIFMCSLDKCMGRLSKEIDDQVMAVYFASNGMEFEKDAFENAPKGEIFEDEFGDNYEFKLIEEENISYYESLINKVDELFSDLVTHDISNLIGEPVLPMSACIVDISNEAKKSEKESEIFKDDKLQVKMCIKDTDQLFLEVNHLFEDTDSEAYFLINDKKTQHKTLETIIVNLVDSVKMYKIKKDVRGKLVELIFFKNNKVYFIKNISF